MKLRKAEIKILYKTGFKNKLQFKKMYSLKRYWVAAGNKFTKNLDKTTKHECGVVMKIKKKYA